MRYAPSGEVFVTFSVAVTTGPKDNQKTDWLEISCNGRTAETVQKWVKKGSKLLIEGTPSAHAYINKEGQAVASHCESVRPILNLSAAKSDLKKAVLLACIIQLRIMKQCQRCHNLDLIPPTLR